MPVFDVKRPLFLAPMASLSHRALRSLIIEFGGCDYFFTEMASVNAVRSGAPFERFYLDTEPHPEKTIIQLVGADSSEFAAVAQKLDERDIFGIDINMGCSAPEIVRQNAGIAWMKDLERAKILAGRVRTALKTKRLSVKLRIGWNDDLEYLVSFCKMLESEGVDFISLHPRIKTDKLTRPPKWERFRSVKEAVAIPVIANGDVASVQFADRLFGEFSADGVMIGRSASAQPWIFRSIKDHENGNKKNREINLEETAFRFIDLLERFLPQEFHETRLRRFFQYFCGNFKFGHHPKMEIRNAKTGNEVRAILFNYFQSMPEDRILAIANPGFAAGH